MQRSGDGAFQAERYQAQKSQGRSLPVWSGNRGIAPESCRSLCQRERGWVLQVLLDHGKVSAFYSMHNGCYWKVLIRGMTASDFSFKKIPVLLCKS